MPVGTKLGTSNVRILHDLSHDHQVEVIVVVFDPGRVSLLSPSGEQIIDAFTPTHIAVQKHSVNVVAERFSFQDMASLDDVP
jgi:hypothetical protein